MLMRYDASMKNIIDLTRIDISTFLKMLRSVHEGGQIMLADGNVYLTSGAIKVDRVKIHALRIFANVGVFNNNEAKPVEVAPSEEKKPRRYKRLRKGLRPFVQPHHYREREKLGIRCRADIKDFPLNKLPGLEKELKSLAGLGIETLGQLVGTGVVGLKYRIQKKYNREYPQLLTRLISAIKQSIEPLGFKYANKHPHNENPDGSPKKALN